MWTQTHMDNQLIFDKGTKTIQGGKKTVFQQLVPEQLDYHTHTKTHTETKPYTLNKN